MPQQYLRAAELNEAEKVLEVAFPAGDQAAEVVQPGREPLHFLPFAISAQRLAVLSSAPSPPVGRDQLDAVLGPELLVEHVRIVSLVADQPGWKLVERARAEHPFDKLALRRASTFNKYGER